LESATVDLIERGEHPLDCRLEAATVTHTELDELSVRVLTARVDHKVSEATRIDNQDDLAMAYPPHLDVLPERD